MREIELKDLRTIFRKLKPERVLLVTSIDEKGKPNVMTIEWFMRTSFEPPLVAISIGKTRYTHGLIKNSKEFVVAFPNSKMRKEVLYCGTHSGRDVDKFKETGLKIRKARVVRAPLIEGCILNLECKVINQLETGDHTIFVGEVVAAYYEEGEILLEFKGWFGGLSDLNRLSSH
jgi:flavin reductase (DIM6/NTAB) family NADH-FMN oxidoreductase RutF